MLKPEQIEFYRVNGYLLVERVFTHDEVAAMRTEIDAALARAAEQRRALDGTWGGHWQEAVNAEFTMTSLHNMQEHSAVFGRMLFHDRLTACLADVIGPNVQLHHNKMHLKPPEKGSPFPLHQDCGYFPHEQHTMTAAIVHVDDADEQNGCVLVVPGSHQQGPLAHLHEGGAHFLPTDEWPLDRAVPCVARAGDVLIFSYLTVHGSRLNTSERPRRLWLVQVRDPLDKAIPHIIEGQAQQIAGEGRPGQGTMLRGINPVINFEIKRGG